MLPEVMEIVAGRRLVSRAAVLSGYERRALRGEVYPGIAPASGARVAGVLWEGLDATALARIDRFESEIYERVACEVEAGRGARRGAEVYVLAPAHRARLLAHDWDEAEFRRRHLADYLVGCREFARGLSAPREQVK
jgi:hypothetical protein